MGGAHRRLIVITLFDLQILHVPESHTGDMISQELRKVLEEWGLEQDKLSAMSTDNASNNVKALKNLGECLLP